MYSNCGFLNLLGLITHSMEHSCLTKDSLHIIHLLFNLSIQHDVIEVMDHWYNVCGMSRKSKTLNIMKKDREVNRPLEQNCK